jgi:hypothetical protein
MLAQLRPLKICLHRLGRFYEESHTLRREGSRGKASARPGDSLATSFFISEFTDCWTNFVNPKRPFWPWKGLEIISRRTQRRLRRIKEVRTTLLQGPAS